MDQQSALVNELTKVNREAIEVAAKEAKKVLAGQTKKVLAVRAQKVSAERADDQAMVTTVDGAQKDPSVAERAQKIPAVVERAQRVPAVAELAPKVPAVVKPAQKAPHVVKRVPKVPAVRAQGASDHRANQVPADAVSNKKITIKTNHFFTKKDTLISKDLLHHSDRLGELTYQYLNKDCDFKYLFAFHDHRWGVFGYVPLQPDGTPQALRVEEFRSNEVGLGTRSNHCLQDGSPPSE